MLSYPDLRLVHMGLAIASVAGFVLRWFRMMTGSPAISHRLARILPHVVDTLFLASGIWLAVTIRQYPFAEAWLTAKVFGLLTYIVLGSLALKRLESRRGRAVAFFAALAAFGWIISVARLKTAWGFLALLP